jgi:hypothetical protein
LDALGDEGQHKKLCATEDSSIVIECEHSKAGLIIGKKAATINMLQEKSGAFIKVATWDGTSATRAVQIRYASQTMLPTLCDAWLMHDMRRGSEDKIQVAKKMICELLGVDEGSVPILPSEAFVNGQPNKQPSFNSSSRSSVRTSRTFLVPTENVGSVIGKGGAFLQSVKDDSRASVIVRSWPAPHTPLVSSASVTKISAEACTSMYSPSSHNLFFFRPSILLSFSLYVYIHQSIYPSSLSSATSISACTIVSAPSLESVPVRTNTQSHRETCRE